MARPCPTLAALLGLILLAPVAFAATAEKVGELTIPPTQDNQPNGLVGAAAVYLDGASYVFGGRTKDGGSFSQAIYRYDHATGATTRVTDFPPVQGAVDPGRYEGAVALLAGKVYYFGGAAQVPVILPGRSEPVPVPTSVKDIVEFDPATGRARKLGVELPYSAWGLAAAAYEDEVYLFGGFSFNIPANEYGRHADVLAFSPAGGLGGAPVVRTLTSTLPIQVQDAAPALLGSRIYLFGGLADHTNETDANRCPTQSRYNEETQEMEEAQIRACETDAVVTFNPETERVLGVTARLPYKPQWAVAASVRGKAYLMGGKLANGAASSSVIEFDPANLAQPIRVLTPTLPEPLIAPAVSTDGQVIHLFGGRGTLVTSATANVTRLDPGPTPPWAPRSPLAQKTADGIRIAWEPPAYNGDAPVTAYRVYRNVSGTEALLQETTQLSVTDPDVQPNVAYAYRITAVNAAGESRTSARAGLTSEPVAPGPVAAFEAFAGNKEVLLRWAPPANDGGANVTGYRVYKNESGTPVRSFPPGTLEWTDTEVENGVTYRYQVAAVNVKGGGALSPSLTATPVAVPPAPLLSGVQPSPSGVVLTWDPPGVSVTSFVVLRGTDPARLTPIANLGANVNTYTDAAVQRGRTYYYSVSASNDVGTSPPSNVGTVSLVSKPGAPLSLIAAPGEGEVRLTWQPPTDTGEAPATALTYYVTRDGTIVATDIKGATYVDRAVLAGREYAYTVTTFNGLESDPSAAARATPRAVVNQPPMATVAVLTSIALPGEEVEVDGSQSTDRDGTIARYVFDFGDGTPPLESSTATVRHAYAANGTYVVTLRVYDNRNAESPPATASLQVGQPTSTDPSGDGDGLTPPTRQDDERPGTDTPKIPAPGLVPTLALLAAAAILLRRGRKA